MKDRHCMISGFHGEVNEICALLGLYAALNDNSIPTFRETYRSRLQGQAVPRRKRKRMTV
jgi:hypothetical protein